MRTLRLLPIALLAAFSLGAAAWPAQAGDPQTRARLRERISDLYLIRLTAALELTEDQTAKIYPVLTRVEREKAALQRDMGRDMRDLRAELGKAAPGQAEVQALTDRIRLARRALREKDEAAEAALDLVLTPLQKGRYLLFTVDFMRRVGENLGRVRRGPGIS
jgi:Spy/CpxP family protein refolding chaperone